MNALLFAQNAGDIGGLFVGFSILWVFMFLLGIAALVVWVWALIDAIGNPALDSTMRIVWVLVIVFTQIIGAIIYLAIGRSRRTPSGA
jgi:Phospholipase_D-nuclease N-terminal